MLQVKEIVSKSSWESFLLKSDQANFLQSWNWGQFHQSLGHKIVRIGFYQKNVLKGVALFIKITAKRGTFLEVPGGPVMSWNQNNLKYFINQAKILAKKETAKFVRLRPNAPKTPENLKLLKIAGLIASPMHLHAQTTWVLDLSQSEQDLLKNMRKNTRYNIKKAQKLGVKIKKSLELKDIDILYNLQLETVKRKDFVPFSREYFKNQLKALKNDNQIQLFKAVYKGKVLAISFIIFYGPEAVYHYSGSSSQDRHIPASYLLQWQAIKEAKNRGLKQYNFWGYTDNPKHRFYGPSLFKKGFGGHRIDYLPAHDLIINKSYWLTYFFESFRKKWRRL